jgi:hypothetical protein
MKTLTIQAAISIVIATLTTVVTTAVTNYLLARPWCIQSEPNFNEQIVYGSNNCSFNDSLPQKRHLTQEGNKNRASMEFQ